MSDQENISRFCDITGASVETAQQFLEIADNNFETAVTLFLENGGTTTQPSRPLSAQSDTDEALARQLQESDVRAPIAPKTDILAGPSNDMFLPTTSSWHVPRSEPVARPSVFNQGDSATGSVSGFFDRFEPEASNRSPTDSPEGVSPVTSKAKRLADLFRPPFDIMFRGNFEEAREYAKEKDKWLLINVQDQTEFACQVMNRDLWSDSFVKDIIRESFVFLQYSKDSADGKRYHTYYATRGFPHLAIIDARTGERVKMWEKQLSPTDFMMDITEFLEHSNAGQQKRPRKEQKNLSEMTEEEQLNAAIAASLNNDRMEVEETKTESNQKQEETKEREEQKEEEEEEDIKAGSAFDGIQAVQRPETTDMANSTRIQLRMGDGSRIIRRFLKSDPVRYLFEFVKAEVPGASNNQQFELVFNRTQLIDILDQSIQEAGLSNAAVNCVFI
ncbi:UBX domain-containing protein 2 [Choanephora cucurbitarum]|uniref:UBX domain-containing protein 2 n=1 Tax=Choanephora cucurbitarum TaxID=101091 RepID=A0A1C7NAB9_9FUNG|nr:UBX domain-containing protein 2 [Choanephora cucurbitarum]